MSCEIVPCLPYMMWAGLEAYLQTGLVCCVGRADIEPKRSEKSTFAIIVFAKVSSRARRYEASLHNVPVSLRSSPNNIDRQERRPRPRCLLRGLRSRAVRWWWLSRRYFPLRYRMRAQCSRASPRDMEKASVLAQR